jgi:hypothetical protein
MYVQSIAHNGHRETDMTTTLKATGERVQVLAIDSDPTCLVWIAFPNTDRDAFVSRADLAGVAV